MHIAISILEVILAFSGIMLLVIAVHEAGHLLAGWMVGLQWKHCRIGPLRISRDAPNHISFVASLYDGEVAHREPDRYISRARYAIFILGGCTANLLLSVLLILIILHEPMRVQDQDGWLPGIAGISLLLAIMNLLPVRSRGHILDGHLLWELCRNGKAFREYEAAWKRHEAEQYRYQTLSVLIGQLKARKRPRTWDAEIIRQAIQIRDSLLHEGLAYYYRYLWAVDRDDMAARKESFARVFALRQTFTDFQNTLLMEKAYWEIVQKQDVPMAQELLTHVAARHHRSATWFRVQAARAWAQGQQDEVLANAQRAREALTPRDLAEPYLLEHLDRHIIQERSDHIIS